MRIRAGGRTDVGRVREGNEDAFMVESPLYAVADGMGGHRGGEVASRVALDVLGDAVRERADDADPTGRLAEQVREANRAVLQRASGDPSLSGMGTTLTALLAGDGEIYLAHVGDSRAYLLRDGELRRLTKDHTVVAGLVDQGRLTLEEAEIHPQRSILTRALGVDGEIEVDEGTHDVELGDRILLCSDGLTGMVDEDRIREILAEHDDPQAAAEALVEAANQAGGQDNVTAVVLDVVEGDAAETHVGERTPAYIAPAATRPRRRDAVPEPAPARRGWGRRLILWVLIPVILVAAGLFVTKRLYVDQQWFVGVHEGNVALFRGIPASPLGMDLFSVVRVTDLQAHEVAEFSPYTRIDEGIVAQSEEDAEAIVAEMRRLVEEREERERRERERRDGMGS